MGDGTTTNRYTPVQVHGPNNEGYLNLGQFSPPTIKLTLDELSPKYFSDINGHNIITISGTVTGKDDCTVTATLERTEGTPFTLSKETTTQEGNFAITFQVDADVIPEGEYKITVVAE